MSAQGDLPDQGQRDSAEQAMDRLLEEGQSLIEDLALAEFASLDPDTEPSPRGRQRRGGKKGRKRRR